MNDKCTHICSKSHKPCDSNSKQELEGKGYCPQHYEQALRKKGTDEVPDIFALPVEKEPNEP